MKQKSYPPAKKQRRGPAPSTRKTPSREPVPPVQDTPAINPKNIVNSVSKAFKVLQAFDADRQELSVNEVASATNLDRGTAFRLVHTFVSLGYLRQVPVRRYRLTLKCLELGFLALPSTVPTQFFWNASIQVCRGTILTGGRVGVFELTAPRWDTACWLSFRKRSRFRLWKALSASSFPRKHWSI
jgi:hypothetical protein